MNIATIRAGIANRAATVTTINCFPTMPGNIDPPAFVVYPSDPFITTESMGAGGAVRVNFQPVLYVAVGSDWPSAQAQLDGFLSATGTATTTSVIDALLSESAVNNATLGGTLHLESVTGYALAAPYGDNGPSYLSAQFNLYLAMLRS